MNKVRNFEAENSFQTDQVFRIASVKVDSASILLNVTNFSRKAKNLTQRREGADTLQG